MMALLNTQNPYSASENSAHLEAREAYHRALALVHDDAERRLLQRRLAGLDTTAGR
jgi:predicted RNA polymerase sigma factor